MFGYLEGVPCGSDLEKLIKTIRKQLNLTEGYLNFISFYFFFFICSFKTCFVKSALLEL